MVYVVPLRSMLPVWPLQMGWQDVWLPIRCDILTFVYLGISLQTARLHWLAPADAGAYSYAEARSYIGVTTGVFFPLAGSFAAKSTTPGMRSFFSRWSISAVYRRRRFCW